MEEQPTQKEDTAEEVDYEGEEEDDGEEYHYVYEDEEDDRDSEERETKQEKSSVVESQDVEKSLQEVKGECSPLCFGSTVCPAELHCRLY